MLDSPARRAANVIACAIVAAILLAWSCLVGCGGDSRPTSPDAGSPPVTDAAPPPDAGTGTCLPEAWRRVECDSLCAPGVGTRACTDAIATVPPLCRDACLANQWGLYYCPEGQP